MKNTYMIHWRGTSPPTKVQGESIEAAFTNAGFGAGAVAAIDYYEPIEVVKPVELRPGELDILIKESTRENIVQLSFGSVTELLPTERNDWARKRLKEIREEDL